ncbi:hypothetical protein GO496_23355 [Acidovorax citrulli]|nr:hypothetical protein [Paracidovorax citrulli]
MDKVRDIVGLYLHPPERVRGREASHRRAQRHRTGYTHAPGQPERHTHDYIRHGITDLFAALDVRGWYGHRRSAQAPSQRGVPPLPADGGANGSRSVGPAPCA